jgi:hypothetical protein
LNYSVLSPLASGRGRLAYVSVFNEYPPYV